MKIIKKIIYILFVLLTSALLILPVFSASVTPQRYEGNDSNPNDYTPPTGCIHYEIPGSGTSGTYTVRFNSSGQVDPNGTCEFTVTVGLLDENEYTQVLSWSSNFPIYAVIVKGGDAFNLYQYANTVRSDTDLVSPDNSSGQPADVSHVSIVFCPGSCPSSSTPASSTTSSSCPSNGCNFIGLIFTFIIIAFLLIGILLGKILCCKTKRDC